MPRWMTGPLEPHDRTFLDLGQHEHEVSVLALAPEFNGFAQEGQEPGLAAAT